MKIMSTSPMSLRTQSTETQNKKLAFGSISENADKIIKSDAVQGVIKTASQEVQSKIGKILDEIRNSKDLILDVINTKNIIYTKYDSKDFSKDFPIPYNRKVLNGSEIFVIRDARDTKKIALISTLKDSNSGDISELSEENLVDGLVDYSKTINPVLKSKSNFFKTIQEKMSKFINGNEPTIFEGTHLG